MRGGWGGGAVPHEEIFRSRGETVGIYVFSAYYGRCERSLLVRLIASSRGVKAADVGPAQRAGEICIGGCDSFGSGKGKNASQGT